TTHSLEAPRRYFSTPYNTPLRPGNRFFSGLDRGARLARAVGGQRPDDQDPCSHPQKKTARRRSRRVAREQRQDQEPHADNELHDAVHEKRNRPPAAGRKPREEHHHEKKNRERVADRGRRSAEAEEERTQKERRDRQEIQETVDPRVDDAHRVL